MALAIDLSSSWSRWMLGSQRILCFTKSWNRPTFAEA